MNTENEIPQLVSVAPLEGYKLKLNYHNGFAGVYDLYPLLRYKVFAPLRNWNFFQKVEKRVDSVVWNARTSWSENIDLCAEVIYRQLKGEKISE